MKTQIKTQIIEAMKAKDTVKLGTLRLLTAAIENEEIKRGTPLSDDVMMSIIRREVKRRQEAQEAFLKGNREELAAKEKAEGEILMTLLPPQLSEEEIQRIIDDTCAAYATTSKKQMGMIMKGVNAVIKGRADGKLISELVQAKLV